MSSISINPIRCSRPKVVIVLIDKDITEGVTEDTDAKLDDSLITYNDPDGSRVSSLPLWAYARSVENLKYYRKAKPDEPGFSDGDIILATEQALNDPAHPEDGEHTRYATKDFFYDAGEPFTLGEYTRGDFPDYPENDVFPPNGSQTYAVAPAGFFNRRYRAIAINGVIITAMCKQLPPPPFPNSGP